MSEIVRFGEFEHNGKTYVCVLESKYAEYLFAWETTQRRGDKVAHFDAICEQAELKIQELSAILEGKHEDS